MVNCAVVGCKNSTQGKRKYQGRFKQVPKRENRRVEWIKLMGRPVDEVGLRFKVCEEHFTLDEKHTPSCFIRHFPDYQEKKCKCRIITKAIPSLNLPDKETIKTWKRTRRRYPLSFKKKINDNEILIVKRNADNSGQDEASTSMELLDTDDDEDDDTYSVPSTDSADSDDDDDDDNESDQGEEEKCRVCARYSDDLVPIFGKEGKSLQLQARINEHLPIQVNSDDPPPLSVCRPCVKRIQECHKLSKKNQCSKKGLKGKKGGHKRKAPPPTQVAAQTKKKATKSSDSAPTEEIDSGIDAVSLPATDLPTEFDLEMEQLISEVQEMTDDTTVPPPPSSECDANSEREDVPAPPPTSTIPPESTSPYEFVCKACKEAFVSPREVAVHRFVAHNALVCEICLKTFISKFSLLEHIAQGHRFSKILRKLHLFTETPPQKPKNKFYVCHGCWKVFNSYDQFETHSFGQCNDQFDEVFDVFNPRSATIPSSRNTNKRVVQDDDSGTYTEPELSDTTSNVVPQPPMKVRIIGTSKGSQKALQFSVTQHTERSTPSLVIPAAKITGNVNIKKAVQVVINRVERNGTENDGSCDFAVDFVRPTETDYTEMSFSPTPMDNEPIQSSHTSKPTGSFGNAVQSPTPSTSKAMQSAKSPLKPTGTLSAAKADQPPAEVTSRAKSVKLPSPTRNLNSTKAVQPVKSNSRPATTEVASQPSSSLSKAVKPAKLVKQLSNLTFSSFGKAVQTLESTPMAVQPAASERPPVGTKTSSSEKAVQPPESTPMAVETTIPERSSAKTATTKTSSSKKAVQPSESTSMVDQPAKTTTTKTSKSRKAVQPAKTNTTKTSKSRKAVQPPESTPMAVKPATSTKSPASVQTTKTRTKRKNGQLSCSETPESSVNSTASSSKKGVQTLISSFLIPSPKAARPSEKQDTSTAMTNPKQAVQPSSTTPKAVQSAGSEPPVKRAKNSKTGSQPESAPNTEQPCSEVTNSPVKPRARRTLSSTMAVQPLSTPSEPSLLPGDSETEDEPTNDCFDDEFQLPDASVETSFTADSTSQEMWESEQPVKPTFKTSDIYERKEQSLEKYNSAIHSIHDPDQPEIDVKKLFKTNVFSNKPTTKTTRQNSKKAVATTSPVQRNTRNNSRRKCQEEAEVPTVPVEEKGELKSRLSGWLSWLRDYENSQGMQPTPLPVNHPDLVPSESTENGTDSVDTASKIVDENNLDPPKSSETANNPNINETKSTVPNENIATTTGGPKKNSIASRKDPGPKKSSAEPLIDDFLSHGPSKTKISILPKVDYQIPGSSKMITPYVPPNNIIFEPPPPKVAPKGRGKKKEVKKSVVTAPMRRIIDKIVESVKRMPVIDPEQVSQAAKAALKKSKALKEPPKPLVIIKPNTIPDIDKEEILNVKIQILLSKTKPTAKCCNICDMPCRSNELRQHYKELHEQSLCTICMTYYDTDIDAIEHCKLQHRKLLKSVQLDNECHLKLICMHCYTGFQDKRLLKKHICEEHFNIDLMYCSCGEEFIKYRSLEKHTEKCCNKVEKSKFSCRGCLVSFAKEEDYTKHIKKCPLV